MEEIRREIAPARKIVTVFGSARPLPGSAEYTIAYELGTLLGKEGFALCNGGYGGTMEASARGAKDAGGMTIGVTTTPFGHSANPSIDRVIRTETPLERLATLVNLGDAYIVLKGATGTLAELAIVWEQLIKGTLPRKPLIALGIFWLPVVEMLQKELIAEGIPEGATYITPLRTPAECIHHLKERF